MARLRPGWLVVLWATGLSISAWLPWLTSAVGGGGRASAIGGALGVVLAKSPVGSLLFMVATLASLAGTFVLLEAHFLAAIQIIVYAGAIMVLFLFVIMLLNLGHDYQRDLRGGAYALLSFVVVGVMAGLLARQIGLSAVFEPGAEAAAIDAAVAAAPA